MRNIFRSRKTVSGSGTEKTVSFKKSVNILNYTPVEYLMTGEFADYSDTDRFETVHAKIIDELAVDEMCGDMYDCEIDGKCGLMLDSARQQLINHMAIIEHHKGIIDGNIAMIPQMIAELENDLSYIDSLISGLDALKESRRSGRNVK